MPPFLALLVTALLAFPASASDNCSPDIKVTSKVLLEKYGEQPIAAGILTETLMLQIFVSETGSFTVIAVSANGTACLVASGENLTFLKPTPEGPES